MAYSSTKLAVKDNYEDDDISDDVDDEVFIRDGRNGFKVDEERGVKRPLMAPRRKLKGNQFHTEACRKPPCSTFCAPCCYGFIALCALLGLIVLITMVVNMFPLPLERIRNWTVGQTKKEKTIIPCTEISTQEIWVQMFPKLVSEAPIKLVDLNGDNVEDVVIGYGTGADDIEISSISCEKYFGHPMNEPCMGGIVALNGQNGVTLWQHWTHRSVLYVDCSTDVTTDGVNDCLISGKGGILTIINGKTGNVVWSLDKSGTDTITVVGSDNPLTLVNVYTAQFIADVDYDGVPDVLAAHTSNSVDDPKKFEGHLMVFSSKTKSQISQVSTPGDGESVLDAPQILVSPDGTNVVVFTTGDVASRGNTYCAFLHNIVKGDMSQYILLSSNGNSVSPVLVDMNDDGTEDIVTANGAYISVYDGRTLNQIWNTTVTLKPTDLINTYISPTPAYFNDDMIPDILVTQLEGPDISRIYYTQIAVLDGKNGQNLLKQPIISSGAVDSPAITVSYQGIGNDYFLYWHASCIGHESDDLPYHIFRGKATPREVSRTDFCQIRFNSSVEMRLYALSQHIEPPGILLYSTEMKWELEHNSTGNLNEPQVFRESSPQNMTPLLNNYRRKGLAPPPSYHHIPNHKPRLQYPPQEINPASYEKMSGNYPFYQEHGGSTQDQWLQAPMNSQELPSFNPDLYLRNMDPNSQRLLPNLLENIGEIGPEVYENYNGDNEEPVGGQSSLDRDRDERESLSGEDEKRRYQSSNRRNNKENSKIKRLNSLNIAKRSIKETERKSYLSRVTAAASLAPSIDANGNIDLVFATHWVPASERDIILLTPTDLQCINTRLQQAEREKFHDEKLHVSLTKDCLINRGVLVDNDEGNHDLKIDKGQLTVYRMRLNCNCTNLNPDIETCSKPLNFQRQSWPNWGGNTYYKKRYPPL